MAEGTTDRKPWFCTTCSDRFATQSAAQHEYIWAPRDKPEEDIRNALDREEN